MPSTRSSESSRHGSGGSRENRRGSNRSSNRSSRKNSLIPKASLPLDPRPSRSDPIERERRKLYEKKYGGFDWTDGLELLCVGAVALFGIDKALEHKSGGSKSSNSSSEGKASHKR
jgi:hypothetical protein